MLTALDLFCGAGGASMGLHQAGFEVIGVDINTQPNYPFEFHQADALAFPADGYDLIWASPPCQSFSAYRRKGHGVGDGYPNLIGHMRNRLRRIGIPYVIENVPSAPRNIPGQQIAMAVTPARLVFGGYLWSGNKRQWVLIG